MGYIKDNCDKSPAFKRDIVNLVIDGPFDSFESTVGRVEAVKNGLWLSAFRNLFIQGKNSEKAKN